MPILTGLLSFLCAVEKLDEATIREFLAGLEPRQRAMLARS
jgi:hypothetical protein